MHPRICVKTDQGLRRKENEDHFLVLEDQDHRYGTGSLGRLLAVADGVSGHKGGAEASRMACEGLLDYYYGQQSGPEDPGDFARSSVKVLKEAFHRVDSHIRDLSLTRKELEGMGTTLSVLVLTKDTALIAHVGDSRIYRLRDHRLEKLTRDHTMAQLSVEMGYMDEEQAAIHPQRHFLTDVVGQGFEKVQTRIEKAAEGDVFLLCTDGLHHGVSDRKIKEILESSSPEKGACDRLVEEAIKGGGRDNVTVIVVYV